MPAPAQSPRPIRFGRYELDLTSGELRKDGQKLPLAPKAFAVVKALVERPGEVVTREELRTKLWPADTFVEFDDSLNHAVKKLRQALGDSAEEPQFIETLPRFGYRFAAQALREITAEPMLASLGVLPLANLSGDPAQEYLADGMTDALITDLAKIGELKVISRTSVMQYKGATKSLPQIARELGVEGVIEGSVQRSDEQLRVTVQLIRAATDTHLWAESYQRAFRDVLSLQAEIAMAVAREIKVALSSEECARLARIRPINPEAYEAYLRGLAHWYHLSCGHLDTALEYFELALQKDPAYALAHVGVANVWHVRGDSGAIPAREAYQKAQEAIAHALTLDDSVAEAHICKGNLLALHGHDWEGAEQEYRRALELSPNNADAHFMYADFLAWMKRWEQWRVEIQRCMELDPVNPFYQCFYGWHLLYLHRFDEAITQLQKSLAVDSGFSSAHLGLWGGYFRKAMLEQALAEARKFFAILGDDEVADTLTRGWNEGGYARAMHGAAEVLAARARQRHVPAIRVARLYAHAGNHEQAMAWLETSYERNESTLVHISVGWDWDRLRSDVRLQDLLRRIGLPS